MCMRMKGKLLPALVVLVMGGLFVACGGGATGARGELTGVKNRPKWGQSPALRHGDYSCGNFPHGQ
jgi:hypothetical protein